MDIKVLSNGIFDSNTYIVYDNGECAVIDCGVNTGDVLNYIEKNSLKVRYIILTHGHIDHIFHAAEMKGKTGAELCIHEDEAALYSDPSLNGTEMFGFESLRNAAPDRLLKHGDKLPLGNTELKIIHTPGHSPGSMCILCENSLFSGDTLFASSVGRTDLVGGSWLKLKDSIENRLYTLPDDIRVYPGHGGATTIGFERENNPYV
ncbi:MAG: MBL fold metallo-hydrolase [Clostridiaceae bacterium]|nr:MBL fold metallo-hydrolase [Clostridiaceae bacterium]